MLAACLPAVADVFKVGRIILLSGGVDHVARHVSVKFKVFLNILLGHQYSASKQSPSLEISCNI